MSPFKRWATRLYLFCQKFKGSSTTREVSLPSSDLVHLTGYSVSNYEIRLYCQKKYYIRKYRWWPHTHRQYSTFRVFSTTTSDAPAALQKACGYLDIVLPPMAPSYVSDKVQKDAVVQAYLDILIDRIRQEQLLRPST